MSKIAEEAALKAYPPKFTSRKRYAKRTQSHLVDTHTPMRTLYIKAYEQAEQDTIERAVSWMDSVLPNVTDRDTLEWLIDDFRKAMEEEL